MSDAARVPADELLLPDVEMRLPADVVAEAGYGFGNVSRECIRDVLDRFCGEACPAAVVDFAREEWHGTTANMSRFCTVIRSTVDGTRRCLECDRLHASLAARGIPSAYHCHAGLIDFVFPLKRQDGKTIGAFLGGQYRPCVPNIPHCVKLARSLALPPGLLQDLLWRMKALTEERIAHICSTLPAIACAISREVHYNTACRDAQSLGDLLRDFALDTEGVANVEISEFLEGRKLDWGQAGQEVTLFGLSGGRNKTRTRRIFSRVASESIPYVPQAGEVLAYQVESGFDHYLQLIATGAGNGAAGGGAAVEPEQRLLYSILRDRRLAENQGRFAVAGINGTGICEAFFRSPEQRDKCNGRMAEMVSQFVGLGDSFGGCGHERRLTWYLSRCASCLDRIDRRLSIGESVVEAMAICRGEMVSGCAVWANMPDETACGTGTGPGFERLIVVMRAFIEDAATDLTKNSVREDSATLRRRIGALREGIGMLACPPVPLAAAQSYLARLGGLDEWSGHLCSALETVPDLGQEVSIPAFATAFVGAHQPG